jgi:hypothetical protein
MAHYALLDDNNVVVNVITGLDETELIEGLSPEEWYGNFHNQSCVRTSYNHRIRKQYAIIGGTYDPNNDVFISPKPHPSWVLNGNHDWEPPIPKPDNDCYWDEEELSWVDSPYPRPEGNYQWNQEELAWVEIPAG